AALLRAAGQRRLRSAGAALVLRVVRAPAGRVRQRRSGADALGVPVAALQPRAAHADLLVPVLRRGVAAPAAAVVPHRPRAGDLAVDLGGLPAPPLGGRHLRGARRRWARELAGAGVAQALAEANALTTPRSPPGAARAAAPPGASA